MLRLADEPNVVAAGVGVPTLAHPGTPSGDGHAPRQAVLLVGGQRPVQPAEVWHLLASAAAPEPQVLVVDVVAGRPVLVAGSGRALDTLQ